MDNKQTINFEGKDYVLEDLSEDSIEYLSHVQNLNQKLAEAEYNAKQLRVALTAFASMFRNSLPQAEETNANQEVQDDNG
jgi:uncharacterized coiled-coil protein SlyX